MLLVQQCSASVVASVLAGASLNAELEAIWRRQRDLTAGERGAVQDICYGTLRHLGTLRAVVAQLAKRPVADAQLDALLLAALYQLEFTSAASHAVVDHAVESAARIGGDRVRAFANALLRNFLRRREELLAAARAGDEGRYSYPPWWMQRLAREFADDAARILEVGNLHPPMSLRVNSRRGGVQAYLQRLRESGLDASILDRGALMLARPVPVSRLPGFDAGDVSVQDAGAQLAASLLDARSGMRVLDACAAPGGKTAHVLELADVDMTALDADPQRLQRVRANLDRLGLDARLQAADAAALESWWDGSPFDRVLLDAPCSGSGVVRRHPDIKWLRRPSDIAGFALQQARLLDAMWKVLARGGKLLYVTCSIFGEEDHETISAFTARHGDARLLGGMPGRDGLLLPDHEHDGFYYALLRKE